MLFRSDPRGDEETEEHERRPGQGGHDGARQARAAGHIESATVKVDKPGQNYEISIEWRVPGRSDTETRTVRT